MVVAASPENAWSLHARMSKISEQELLDKPDLAAAVDGWEQACLGVQAQALARWRQARREACFWQALCRQPSPEALLSAVKDEKRMVMGLPVAFDTFLRELGEQEDEAWEQAQSAHQGSAEYGRVVEGLVSELFSRQVL